MIVNPREATLRVRHGGGVGSRHHRGVIVNPREATLRVSFLVLTSLAGVKTGVKRQGGV